MAQHRVTVLGDRVCRPAGWWTPTVHALLSHLHDVGFTAVPKPLGIINGQEFLSFLPGDSGRAGWRPAATDAGLRALARLLRAHGDPAPCVEVLPAGDPPAYHRAALAGSTLLWRRTEAPTPGH